VHLKIFSITTRKMAGTYTRKDFGVGPEEQTLLKDSNGTRIVPAKGNRIRMYSLMPPIMAMWECSSYSFLGISSFLFSLFYFPIMYTCSDQSVRKTLKLIQHPWQ